MNLHLSAFARDPLCKNTCRYCRCRPCDVGIEHDDHTCYDCEQRLLHPEGVPGAPWQPPLTPGCLDGIDRDLVLCFRFVFCFWRCCFCLLLCLVAVLFSYGLPVSQRSAAACEEGTPSYRRLPHPSWTSCISLLLDLLIGAGKNRYLCSRPACQTFSGSVCAWFLSRLLQWTLPFAHALEAATHPSPWQAWWHCLSPFVWVGFVLCCLVLVFCRC